MLGSPIVKELILRGDIHGFKEITEKSKDRGMKTFDMALLKLCQSGVISERTLFAMLILKTTCV